MKVIADLCIVPMGVGVSVSAHVAECEKILRAADLNPQLHAYGTSIEGEWKQVAEAIERCHEKLHDMGVPRLSSTLRFGSRVDREQSASDKVNSVKSKLQ